MNWRDFLPGPLERGDEAWARTRSAPLRGAQRIDPVWIALLVGGVIALVMFFSILGVFRDKSISLETVPDNRILAAYDTDTSAGGCFAAVAADHGGDLLVSIRNRRGCGLEGNPGAVTSYDPVWRLWGDETFPFEGDVGTTNPGSLARVGGRVWVRGDDGGLAMRTGTDWRVWLSQSQLRIGTGTTTTVFGATRVGRPAETRDVVAVASHPGKTHTLIALRDDTSSLYEASTGRWSPAGRLPGRGAVKEILWANDTLWILRPTELWRATLSPGGASIRNPERVHVGTIAELALDGTKGVIGVETVACAGPPSQNRSCRRLLELPTDGTRVTALLDNTNAPRSWALDEVSFVEARTGDVIVGGPGGVRRYSIAQRHWTVLEREPVIHFAAAPNGDIAYAGRDFVARLGKDAFRSLRFDVPKGMQRPEHLFFAGTGALFIEMGGGQLLRQDGETLKTVFERTLPTVTTPPVYSRSSATHDLTVFARGQLSMAHGDRSYRAAGFNRALRKLERATVQSMRGNTVFAFVPRGNGGSLIYFDPARPGFAIEQPITTIRSISKRDETNAILTTTTGRILRAQQTGGKLLISDQSAGQPTAGPDTSEVADVVASKDAIAVASKKGLSLYDSQARQWRSMPVRGAFESVDFGAQDDTLYASSERKDLFAISRPRSRPKADRIIASFQFPHGDGDALHDTLRLADGNLLFLGRTPQGIFRFARYDVGARHRSEITHITAQGRGRILAYESDERWLLQIGTRLYSGAGLVPLAESSTGARDGWLEADGSVVAVETDRATDLPYLHRRDMGRDVSSCLFRRTAFPLEQPLYTFALSDAQAVLGTLGQTLLYDRDAGDWRTVDTAPVAHAVATRGSLLWLSPLAGEGAGDLLRVDLAALPAVESCAADLSRVPVRNIGRALVSSNGRSAYRLTNTGAVERAQDAQPFVAVVAPSRRPPVEGPPLRAMQVPNGLLLAYSDSILRYSVPTRKWTKLLSVPTHNWDQVLLANGEGPNAGLVVASFIDGQNWLQVAFPRNAQNAQNARRRIGTLPKLDALPRAASFGPLRAMWRDASSLHFRFQRQLVTLSLRDGTWHERFTLGGDADRIGIVGQRLIGWNPVTRQITSLRRSISDTPPVTLVVPPTATGFVNAQGLPGYVTRTGGVFDCPLEGACAETEPPRRALDRARVSRVFEVGEDYVVVGADGLAARFLTRSRQWQSLSDARRRLHLEQAQAEPLGALRPARDGGVIFRTLASGRPTVFSGTPRLSVRRLLQSDTTRLINPDDEVALTADGRVSGPDLALDLPDAVHPRITAIGRVDDALWFQVDNRLILNPVACYDAQADLTQTDCTSTRIDLPAGITAAYLDTPVPGAFSIVATDGSGLRASLQEPVAVRTEAAFGLPLIDPDDFLAKETTIIDDRRFSVMPGVTVTAAGRRLTLGYATGQRRIVTALDGLRLPEPTPENDWLTFDAERGSFFLDGAGRRLRMDVASAFSAGGAFFPLSVRKPAPQPNGEVLALVPGGMVRAMSLGSLSDIMGAGFTATGEGDMAQLVPDTGGYWRGETFLPVSPTLSRETPLTTRADGRLRIVEDRRLPGVTVSLDGRPALDAQGFAWDRPSDIGITPDDRIVARTPVGPVLATAPFAPLPDAAITWRDQMMSTMSASTDKSETLTDLAWRASPDRRFGFIEGDILRSAAKVDGKLFFLTRAALERSSRFARPRRANTKPAPYDNLRHDRRLNTLVASADGRREVIDPATLQGRPLNAAETAKLIDPLEWRTGPLRAERSGAQGYALRVMLGDTAVPTLGPSNDFMIDSVLSVKGDGDGGYFILTEAGLFRSTGGIRSLARWEGIAGTRNLVRLMRHGAQVLGFTENDAACLGFNLETARPVACPPDARGMAATVQPDGGTMVAQRTDTGWTFRDQNAEGAPLRPVNLRDGRFSHDRFDYVATCEGRLHLVDADGYHATTKAGNGWTALRGQALLSTPRGLFCAPQDRVAPIARGTWLFENGRGWSLMPQNGDVFRRQSGVAARWAESTFGAPPAFRSILARYSKRQAMTAGNGPSVTAFIKFGPVDGTRDFNNDDILRAPEGGRAGAAVDLPQRFFVWSDEIWAVTADGIVPYGKVSDTRLRLAPAQGVRVRGDISCRVAEAMWRSPVLTDLICADGRLFQFDKADGGPHRITARGRVPEAATHEVGPLRMVTRRGRGIDEISLHDEPVPGLDFTFDRVRNVQTQSDTVHLLTAAGWHAYPRGSLALGERGVHAGTMASRRAHAILRQAIEIEEGVQDGLLCVNAARGQTFLIKASGPRFTVTTLDRTSCPTLLGRDALRTHWRGDDQQWYPFLTLGPRDNAFDRLSQGRFSSDKASGLPRMVPRDARTPDRFCVASDVRGVAIWGTSERPKGRMRTRDCRTAHAVEAPRADRSLFAVQEGQLTRQRER